MAEADPQKTFNVDDTGIRLSELADRAHAGEEIVLAKAGQPWAKLVSAAPKRMPGGLTLTGPIDWDAFSEPMPEEFLACFGDRPERERP